MRVQIINADGLVVNVILVDGEVPAWAVPSGCTAREETADNAGAPWVPNPPTPAEVRASVADAYAALPLDARKAFASVYVTAERFMDLGQWDVAIGLISDQTVTDDLQPVKDGFLAALRSATPGS